MCSAVISAKGGYFDESNIYINFVQQNDSMISFLFAIAYLFYALISEYIETLNCLNFSKNWKNWGVLKLLTGSVCTRKEHTTKKNHRHDDSNSSSNNNKNNKVN